jgi:catechol 2,3-dioxygenase-like lactoylglutathione lyase family enzyme
MRLGKLPYVTLWTVKFEETRKFYKDVLGIPVFEENPSFIMFDTTGSRLAFHKLPKGPRLDRQTIELHLEVDNVDEIYASLQKKGVKFDEKPENKPWGTRMASLRDPEGYTVEIIGPLREDEPHSDAKVLA